MTSTFLIRSVAELDSYRQQWNELAGLFPFHRWEWMMAWLENVHPDFDLAIVVQRDSEQRWIGIAPFCVQTTRTYARKINFIGCGSVCSDYSTLICTPEHRDAFVRSVADWIILASQDTDLIGGFNILEFDGVAADDIAVRQLVGLLEQEQFLSHQTQLDGCWVAGLPDSWQTMNAGFSKSLRRKTKAAVKNLDNEQTEIVSSKNVGVDSVWDSFVELHQKRRAMLGEEGCFACRNFASFLKGATIELAAAGLAEVVIIKHTDRPLAGMLLYNDTRTVMMYQSGIDPEFLKSCLGYQLAVQALRSSIEGGFRHFDFLRGDEPYKARWKTSRVPMLRIRMAPPKLIDVVRQNVWTSVRSFKSLMETSSPEIPMPNSPIN